MAIYYADINGPNFDFDFEACFHYHFRELVFLLDSGHIYARENERRQDT